VSAKTQAFIDGVLQALRTKDYNSVYGWLADEVELNTPRFLKPIRDKKHFAIVLQTIPRVLEDFRYERTWPGDSEAIMEFKGRIGEVQVHGLDIFALDEQGKVRELTVFIRPTKAHAALGEAEDALILEQLKKSGGGG
jgi:hypothetical protein